MNRGTQWGFARYLFLFDVAGTALLACSSSDGSGEIAAESANGASTPAAPGGSSTAPAAGNESSSGNGSGTGAIPGSGGEAQNEALPLTPGGAGTSAPSPGPAMPAATPASPGEPGPPPSGVIAGPLGAPMQQALPDLISVRQEHAVVALNGEIYVIGGFTPMVTGTVEAFNPATETWRAVASLPTPLHHANAVSVDGRIYVAGFYLGASFTNADPRVLEYDPTRDAWSERTAMPAGSQRASACVAALEGKIYVFGGARATTVTDASVYDVAADTWQALPPLPEAREHCVAGAIGGSLFIASGRAGGITGFQPNTWQFDPATAVYTPRAPISTPRGGTAGAVLGEQLVIFGGEGNPDPTSFGVFPNIDAYDPAADTWQALAPMLLPRHGFGAAASDGRIFLPGGAAAQGFGAVSDHTVVSFDAAAL